MNHIKLSSYSALELSNVLRVLKSYTTSSKQIGRRAKLEDPKHPDAPILRVEFAPDSDRAFIHAFSEQILTKFFPEAKKETCVYEPNKDLAGGIRIFLADDMVDISFERFAHLIQNV